MKRSSELEWQMKLTAYKAYQNLQVKATETDAGSSMTA